MLRNFLGAAMSMSPAMLDSSITTGIGKIQSMTSWRAEKLIKHYQRSMATKLLITYCLHYLYCIQNAPQLMPIFFNGTKKIMAAMSKLLICHLIYCKTISEINISKDLHMKLGQFISLSTCFQDSSFSRQQTV